MMPATKRRVALENFNRMLDALEEHHAEAEKEENEEWATCLGRIKTAFYNAALPTKNGELTLKVNLLQN